jgi:Copper binding periplasmic protein CusF
MCAGKSRVLLKRPALLMRHMFRSEKASRRTRLTSFMRSKAAIEMHTPMEEPRGMSLVYRLVAFSFLALFLVSFPNITSAQGQAGGPTAGARPIGTIKTISGNSIVLASDAGPVFNVTVEDGAKIVRIEPGAKDLRNATPVQLQDLLEGDRILVLGKISDDGRSVDATSVIVMKKADLASKQEHDRQEWQRHAVGGLVNAVDPSSGTVTISMQSFAGLKSVTIQVSKDTIVRRYAADSVKFDDAKPSSLSEIKPGDQVRARGTRSADGSQLGADEVVSGAFRNIAGIVTTADAATNTLTINDLISKKTVTVKIAPESQLRKLPPQMAQMMAIRLKGGGAAAGTGDGGVQPPAGQSGNGGPGGAGGRSGGGDMQQILSRVPPASFSDVQKGDAVMIVSTEGAISGSATVITLLAGVEPILQASPNGGQAMILPPWSLDAPAGDAAQ